MLEWAAIASWLGFLLLVGLAAWPLAALTFPRWTDRGAALAIPLGLVVIWCVTYWTGHLSLAVAPYVGLGALVAASIAASRWRSPSLDPRSALEPGIVFAVAFLFVVAFRAVDPAVHPIGGEKFLDFGLLKAILRADALPPEDMWFAGEPVQYYYGGHLLVAALSRLTGVPAALAYNLGLATTYAALVTGVYGLAGQIAHANGRSHRVAAVAGAFAVGIASNLEPPSRVVLWLLPDRVARGLATALGDADAVSWTPADFSYWSASRIIEGAINEFPLFAWLNGDLHAHMSSTPFLVLLLGLLFAAYRTPPEERRRCRLLLFGAVPLVGGLLAVVNTWSFPTLAGLTWLTLTFAPGAPSRLLGIDRWHGERASVTDPDRGGSTARSVGGVDWRAELRRTLTAALAGVVTLALSALVALPFWLGTASTRSIKFLPERTGAGALLLVLGGFIAVFLVFLVGRLATQRDRVSAPLLLLAGVLLVGAWVGDAPAVALVGPLLIAGWIGARTRDLGFEAVPLVAGAGLVLVVEFAFVQEQAGPGRFNTVFKTYMQVWVCWAVAAGVAVPSLLRGGADEVAAARSGNAADGVGAVRAGLRRWGPPALIALLGVSTLLYAGFALEAHFQGEHDPTLDATRFVEERHPEEAAAIRWIDRREGTPTIVTAAPGGYNWAPQEGKGASAPSSLTGVPTVAGWFHERGYRGGAVFSARVADVRTIYEGPPDKQRRLLERYDVEYIYVGPAERARYDLDLPELPLAHESGGVRIYRVPDSDTAGGDGVDR
jgi:YYY domain-containing protein